MALTLEYDDAAEAQLLAGLGLPAAEPGTTDPELVKATIADLCGDEQSEEQAPGGDTGDTQPPSQLAASAKKAGLEMIDASSADALRRDAAAGRQLIAAEAQRKVEATVDQAIDRGKITPARKKHWVSLIAADPGMADVLSSVPDETAIPMAEMGHATAESDTGLDRAPDWFYRT